MASTWIHACSCSFGISAATTVFLPIVGNNGGVTTTEAQAQILVRDTYTASNLWTIVSINDNNGITTIRTRKNAGNGAQSVSYAASTTGTKEDTVNTDAMATGENWNYSVNPAGASGIITPEYISVVLQHSGTGTFILSSGATTTLSQAENIKNYESLNGGLATRSVEAHSQYTLRTDGILRNLRVYVSANSIGANTVVRTRVNAGNGAQVATITASTTGSFEDTTNSDTITGANADEWNCIVDSTSAKMGTLVTRLSQVEMSCVGQPQIFGEQIVATADRYIGVAGASVGSTLESQTQLKARVALTIAKMFTYVSANTTTVCDVYLRQNGANTALTVNYGSGVTGVKEDTTNTVSIVATDLINYFVDLTSGTNITFQIIGSEAQQGATGADGTDFPWPPTGQPVQTPIAVLVY